MMRLSVWDLDGTPTGPRPSIREGEILSTKVEHHGQLRTSAEFWP